MDRTGQEAPKGGLTRERFLKDVRPLLDEALRQRVGVLSVELYSVEGALQSYFERLRAGVPRVSQIEITPNSLEASKHVPEIEDWERSNVFFGSLDEGEAPRFYLNQTNTPIKEVDETEWERVLEQAKDSLTLAVSGQSQAGGQRPKESEDERGEGWSFIREYDRLFQEASNASAWGVSTFPSELYPGYGFKATLVFGESNAQELEMQSFLRKKGAKPVTRLLKVSNDRGLSGGVLVRDLPSEVNWYEHIDKHPGTPLTSEERTQVLTSAQNILRSAKRAAS